MIKQFAKDNRLKVRIDVDQTEVILGRVGQIYEHNNEQLAVMYLPKISTSKKKWGNIMRKSLPLGLSLLQNGDYEGSFLFDHNDPKQVQQAIQVARIRVGRILTEEQKAQLRNRLAESLSRASKKLR